jgi:adenylate cyclase
MDLTTIFNRSPRILIAEDDWMNRDLLEVYLKQSNCDVITAADGRTALDLAREHLPDLALVDVKMPAMDGIELCKEMKSGDATRSIPVVIVTAMNSDDEKIRAIDAGADDFITKPYNSLVLLTRVRSLMRIKKFHDEIEARNRLLRQVLDRYVAEDVADVILTDPERYLQLGGESRLVTVLFADIRGFTRFSEKLPARHVIKTLNHIFEPLSRVLFTYRGTFDKYLGDGLMAFYGAPVSAADDAQRALQTAIDMQKLFLELRQSAGDSMGDLGLGIGLHSGEAVVGNIGSEKVMDYTVVGDVVNVAKRLQDRARGGEILLSEATYQESGMANGTRLDPIELPGRSELVPAYMIKSEIA